MQNASLPKNEESLAAASLQGKSAFAAAARQMRRLFGSCGNAAHQDVLIAADMGVLSDQETDHAAWLARRKAKKGRDKAQNEEEEGGEAENVGKRDARIASGNSEYHFARQRPQEGSRRKGSSQSYQVGMNPSRPSYSSIAMDSPICVRHDGYRGKRDQKGNCEQSFSTDLGGQVLCAREDSFVVLDTGAAANLACFLWLENHNSFLEICGFPKVST